MKPWQNSEGYNDPTAYSTIKAENARQASHGGRTEEVPRVAQKEDQG